MGIGMWRSLTVAVYGEVSTVLLIELRSLNMPFMMLCVLVRWKLRMVVNVIKIIVTN